MRDVRLISLEVRNWRACEHAKIKEGHEPILIVGNNGHGKTSLLVALQEILYGRSYDANGKAIPGEYLINHWADQAEATAVIEMAATETAQAERLEFKLNIARQKKGSKKELTILDPNGVPRFPATAAKENRQAFFELAEIDPQQAHFGMNAAAYMHGHADFDDLLSGYLTRDIGFDQVQEFAEAEGFGEHLPAFLAQQQLAPETVADLKGVGKTAYDVRRELNRKIKEIKSRLDGMADLEVPVSNSGKPLVPEQIPTIQQLIDQKREERNGLIGQRERLAGAAGKIQTVNAGEVREDLETEAREADERLESAAQYAAEMKAVEFHDDDECKKALAALNEKQDAAETAKQKAQKIDEKIRAWKREQQHHSDMIRFFEEHKECPRCFQKIPDDLRTRLSNDASTAWGEAQTAIEELEAQRPEAEKEKQAAIDAAAKQQDVLSDLRKRKHAKLSDEKSAAIRAEMEARNEARQARERLEQYDARMAENAADSDADPEELNRQIADCERRIEAGAEKVRKLEAIQERDKVQAELEHHENMHAFYEWMVENFYHGKYIREAMKPNVDALQESINAVLGDWGRSLEIVVGDAITLHLDHGDGEAVTPLAYCSKGERIMVEIAAARALWPSGITAIDDIEGLDGRNKNVALDGLAEAAGGPGTLILLAAYTSPRNPDCAALAEHFDPVRLVWMTNGLAAAFQAGGE